MISFEWFIEEKNDISDISWKFVEVSMSDRVRSNWEKKKKK